MADPINPAHYRLKIRGREIECFDAFVAMGINVEACVSNALKYAWRLGRKPEAGETVAERVLQDVKKILWYCDRFEMASRVTTDIALRFGQFMGNMKALAIQARTLAENGKIIDPRDYIAEALELEDLDLDAIRSHR